MPVPPPSDWFTVREIAHATWAIDDHGGDVIYLVAGQARCLLIDTGWGIGDLPALATSLSPLPLTVVNTHGHPDHVSGNGAFPEVHIHSAEAGVIREPAPLEERQWSAENVLPKPLPAGFAVDAWAATAAGAVIPIEDGHRFDLGGRVVETIAVPGHTAGCIGLLDRATRSLFAGDSIVGGTIWLHLEHSLPLELFGASLCRLVAFSGLFDHIWPGHGSLERLGIPPLAVDELIRGIESILSGSRVGCLHRTFAGDGLRCDFRHCSLVYRPDRLRDG